MSDYDSRIVELYDGDNPDGPDHDFYRSLASDVDARSILDLGWPLPALKGIGLLCRTASLIGHLTEEAERPIGFIMSGAAAQAIEYDGV